MVGSARTESDTPVNCAVGEECRWRIIRMTNTTALPATSITRELDRPTSDLRQLLLPYQPLLDRWRRRVLANLSGQPWIRPERTRLAWMAGHAFDYRTRWFLTGVGSLPETVLAGLAHCPQRTVRELGAAFDMIVGTAPGVLPAELERRVCAVAVAAASVEPLYRAGAVPCALVDLGLTQFNVAYGDVIGDVICLATGLPQLVGEYAHMAIRPGPITGVGRMAGDADFIAGGELVEVKCVVSPRDSATRAVRQLLVYAARLRPASAALLLPRQHSLVRFDLAEYTGLLADLDAQIELAYGR